MQWYYLVLIALGVVVVFSTVTTFASALVINKAIFGSRQDKNPFFRYFTPEDYALKSEQINVEYSGISLYSMLYTARPIEECEKVVIFVHGFGAGSSSYMTEIAHFCKQGFAVVATDAFGCNNSAGKNVKSFYAGAEAVIATFIAVKKHELLKDKKVILVGHSWGAYSALAATQKIGVDGVVAMSGFNAPAQCVCDSLRAMGGLVKAYSYFVHFWLWLINLFKMGAKGNTKAVKALKKSGVKALLIQGEKDRAVPLKHSAAVKAKGDNVTKLILSEKRHNPYNTDAAEEKLLELSKKHNFASEEEAKAYFAEFDWVQAVEEDEKVLKTVDDFIASC